MNTKNFKGRGFTLVELMITMVMLSIIVVAIVSVVLNSQKAKRNTELLSEAQQTARMLVDMISDDIRSAGYGANTISGHTPIVYAAPYDIMISANLAPYPDDPAAHASPVAVNPIKLPLPGGASPLYDGGAGFTDGAETIRYAFDSDNNGTVTTDDRGDDLEERLTRNDSLYSITRQVFGYNSVNDNNGGTPLPVGLARSNFPARASGATLIKPLFQYWISTSDGDVLWGDTDGDSSLSDQEIANLAVVPASDLGYISRVIITVTTATKTPNSKNKYEEVEISTTTTITRNITITEARVISGKVAVDANDNQIVDGGETGISNVTVKNRTDGQETKTDVNGRYSFNVEAKKHTIEVILPNVTCTSTLGYKVKPPAVLSYLVDAITADVDTNFALVQYIPGYVSGVVFVDANGSGDPAGQVGIPGCTVVLVNSVMSATTASDGSYCIAAPPITGDSIKCIPVVHDPEYVPTIPANGINGVNIGTTLAVQNFGFVPAGQATISGKVYLDNGNGAYDVGEAGIAGVSLAVYYRASAATSPTLEQYLDIEPPPVTAADGTFKIKVASLASRYYSLTEIDPSGYFSTTTNRYDIGFLATGDSIYGKYFGDMKLTAVSFSASNVLSMTVNDFREYEVSMATEKNDTDIVLGTKYESGRGNIRGWFNKRYLVDGTQTTDVNQLFELGNVSTTRFQYAYEQKQFPANVNIQAIASDTMNHKAKIKKSGSVYSIAIPNFRNSRHRKDLVLGLSNTTSITYNVAVWPSMDTCTYLASSGFIWDSIGAAVTAVTMDSVPYKLIAGGNSAYPVNALAVANFGNDGFPDIVAGFSSATNTGGFQLWINTLNTSWSPSDDGKYLETRTFPTVTTQCWTGMGEVKALGTADIVGNAYNDLVVGTRDGTALGSIVIYTGLGLSPWFTKLVTLNPLGEVTCLKLIDINSDGKKDIVAGVRTAAYKGNVQVWLQDPSDPSGATYTGPSFVPFSDAEPVCLDAAVMKWYTAAVSPHIVVGVCSSDTTGKTMIFDCSEGVLPGDGSDASGGAYLGAVAAVKIADFSMDGRKDIAVADKYGTDLGRLIIYYAQ